MKVNLPDKYRESHTLAIDITHTWFMVPKAIFSEVNHKRKFSCFLLKESKIDLKEPYMKSRKEFDV